MKKASVSQQQIARDLGVSQALVSLVLNGKGENISRDSYDRIWKYAVKVGYRPKGMQLNGTPSMASNVGFILRAGVRLYTQSNYFSHIQHGLHTGLLERGYHTFFFGSEDDLRIKTFQQRLKHHQLFGLVILGEVDKQFLKAIKAVQKNVVAVSATYPGLCHSVMPNEKQSLQLLAEHLIALGHKQFAWIGGNRTLNVNSRRRDALIEALEHHGLKLADKGVVEVDGGDRLDGWKAAEMLLSRVSPQRHPTALVCLNGLMARGAINCLTANGWHVPQDMSVVAVDATRVCVEEHPEITGAHADPEKIGLKAAELLLQALNSSPDESFSDVILPAVLTQRESSGKAA
jgi:LacI family transcriptional regulator